MPLFNSLKNPIAFGQVTASAGLKNACIRSLELCRYYAKKIKPEELDQCYRTLDVPHGSNHEVVRQAFLNLAKKYHPDSGSSEADEAKFCAVENAFRTICRHSGYSEEKVQAMEFDIKHTAPQHRQYLSNDGYGYGTPFQREKQYRQHKANRAAINVMEHKVSRAIATEGALLDKQKSNKHNIKTKYGFDRLVEDLIQESMSRGEFDNLKGKGKPISSQNHNPYVDFTTHKLNEVLINNGFTPEWITLNKEIRIEVEELREKLSQERAMFGSHPLDDNENERWDNICLKHEDLAKNINKKINTYNLIVPILTKQKLLIIYEEICDEILRQGVFHNSLERNNHDRKTEDVSRMVEDEKLSNTSRKVGDLFDNLFQMFVFKRNR